MSADIQAADRAAPSVVFELSADPNPGLLPRLVQPFARRNLVPERFAARLQGGCLKVEIGLAAAPPAALRLIEGNLRQIIGVREIRRRVRLYSV
ncbi:MAG: hypothetical protein ACREFZ_01595 [Acetobacteraceae bacterium]